MRTLPPLNALRAFEAAARHESFTRAAEELSVSHSAISRHVRGLEARLGLALFKSASRGVTLTPEGAHYLARITPAFDVIGAATEGLSDRPEGRVVINCEPLFAAKVLAPNLALIQSTLPDVALKVVGSTALADLDRFEADIAIRFAHTGVLDIPADLLSAARIYPYAAPGLVDGDILTPADLTRFARFRDRRDDLWPAWAAAAGWQDIDLSPTPYDHRNAVAIEAALHRAGLFLAAADCTHVDEKAGRLVRLSEVSLARGAFYIITSPVAQRRKAVRAVRQIMLDITAPFRET
ncbi:MAG: LysR family transcriptional regulator [Pseudomonadota bacterium]